MAVIQVLNKCRGNIFAPKKGDVGFDIATSERAVMRRGEFRYISTGVHVVAPVGTWYMLVGRSSAASKFGLMVNQGIIDAEYSGELRVGSYALQDVTIPENTRLAQLIFFTAKIPDIEYVEAYGELLRGEAGFGSTGI
jgi:dUTP pyrophosphatase